MSLQSLRACSSLEVQQRDIIHSSSQKFASPDNNLPGYMSRQFQVPDAMAVVPGAAMHNNKAANKPASRSLLPPPLAELRALLDDQRVPLLPEFLVEKVRGLAMV